MVYLWWAIKWRSSNYTSVRHTWTIQVKDQKISPESLVHPYDAPQVFNSESEALGISRDCFHLASNSCGNHTVKRQTRSLLQMSQTSAKPNICLAWLADEGGSQQAISLQVSLVFQFSCLSDTREKQLPISHRKKEEEDKIEGQALWEKKENSYSENSFQPHFSNFMIGVYSYHEIFNTTTTLIFKPPLIMFLVKFFTTYFFFFSLFFQQHCIRWSLVSHWKDFFSWDIVIFLVIYSWLELAHLHLHFPIVFTYFYYNSHYFRVASPPDWLVSTIFLILRCSSTKARNLFFRIHTLSFVHRNLWSIFTVALSFNRCLDSYSPLWDSTVWFWTTPELFYEYFSSLSDSPGGL